MSELRAAGRQLTATLRSPLEVLLGIAAAGGLLALTVWLPNLGLLWHQTVSSRLPLAGRLDLLWSSLGALGTNFTPLEAALMVAVAILFGLTMAVTAHGLRRRTTGQAAGSLGVAGAAAGLLGAGCSTCGTVLLSSLLGTGASAAFAATLPLHGLEFPIASLLLLATALLLTARSAARSTACAIPRRPDPPRPAATGSASE